MFVDLFVLYCFTVLGWYVAYFWLACYYCIGCFLCWITVSLSLCFVCSVRCLRSCLIILCCLLLYWLVLDWFFWCYLIWGLILKLSICLSLLLGCVWRCCIIDLICWFAGWCWDGWFALLIRFWCDMLCSVCCLVCYLLLSVLILAIWVYLCALSVCCLDGCAMRWLQLDYGFCGFVVCDWCFDSALDYLVWYMVVLSYVFEFLCYVGLLLFVSLM